MVDELGVSLRIYPVIIEMVAAVHRIAEQVRRKDPDLARQMRRASTSVALNYNEGIEARGGNRTTRLHSALDSTREVVACLDVCVASQYLQATGVETTRDRLDHIAGTLYRLIHYAQPPR